MIFYVAVWLIWVCYRWWCSDFCENIGLC